MERHHLICGLLGYFIAKNPRIRSQDLSENIDEVLAASSFTVLGKEDGDLQLLDEMIAEFTMSVIARGFNRADRRKKKK